ncbi:beta-ketoacyl synthase N-terminal-like domain-containing protein [Acinetobacter pittii]|uniref:beta-ketoacyl synthase N-terminal-like domain-containing protein n=1 Tax=Acinetobacter pittii TaxID=48296 RepID=UPI001580DE1E|nr:beta-ketoacyl synthase N-terminal-like domain-containing protein [Acinetobacter pittii]NUF45383.1 hypothetical protein [Acinetobacter pittii]
MTTLFIKNAAAVSPLGENLNKIWQNLLLREAKFGQTHLPGNKSYFSAESKKGSSQDINTYAPLFYNTIRNLINALEITETVDAIFFATAVGNLANIENKIYSKQNLNLEEFDFTKVRELFLEENVANSETHFVCVPTGCCAGLQAIGLAKSLVDKLNIKTAIIMSIDFGLSPLAFEAFNKINATSEYQDDLQSSPSRPFCQDRGGFLFADGGGAILITKDTINQPKITGYGCVSSAYHMTDIATDGSSIRDSMQIALADSGLNGKDIDHINLHASGTQQNDEAEFNALREIIGEDLPEITAFKGNHGHALGGANMIEIALSWKMLKENLIPPTPNGLPIDAYKPIIKREETTPFTGKTLLKTASGFSGIHASLIMEK